MPTIKSSKSAGYSKASPPETKIQPSLFPHRSPWQSHQPAERTLSLPGQQMPVNTTGNRQRQHLPQPLYRQIYTSGGGVQDARLVAYAKIMGTDFEYFMQTLSIVIGRMLNQALSGEPSHLDVDLTGYEGVDARHCTIMYNFDSEGFELKCLSETYNVQVNDVIVNKTSKPYLLKSKDLVIVGEAKFYFLLPQGDINHDRSPHDLSKSNMAPRNPPLLKSKGGYEGSQGAIAAQGPGGRIMPIHGDYRHRMSLQQQHQPYSLHPTPVSKDINGSRVDVHTDQNQTDQQGMHGMYRSSTGGPPLPPPRQFYRGQPPPPHMGQPVAPKGHYNGSPLAHQASYPPTSPQHSQRGRLPSSHTHNQQPPPYRNAQKRRQTGMTNKEGKSGATSSIKHSTPQFVHTTHPTTQLTYISDVGAGYSYGDSSDFEGEDYGEDSGTEDEGHMGSVLIVPKRTKVKALGRGNSETMEPKRMKSEQSFQQSNKGSQLEQKRVQESSYYAPPNNTITQVAVDTPVSGADVNINTSTDVVAKRPYIRSERGEMTKKSPKNRIV
eukprot:CFRG1692T1